MAYTKDAWKRYTVGEKAHIGINRAEIMYERLNNGTRAEYISVVMHDGNRYIFRPGENPSRGATYDYSEIRRHAVPYAE
jgi:hypothetical protein